MNETSKIHARRVLTDPVNLLAFGLGAGLAPLAPGTVGSLLGVLLAWIVQDLTLLTQIGGAVFLFVAGIWICGESARRIGVHDHGGIVWDEICGTYVTLLVAPPQIAAWAVGFLLFRAFDIVKPWPIRDLDHRLGGGLGIMLDDLVAALYAAILLASYRWLMT
ncbi:MAG: phosphatidylglycerophosphatase A [Gammaproteobacteria bacterium]|nr:phosphatidylglycerophosphatase A [Gammaproteobacteria bacterium]